MWAFLIRRLLAGIVTLFCIATICFFIMRLAPGSPFAGERTLDPVVLDMMERKYGLDKPLPVQYANVMVGYLKGDLGESYHDQGYSVRELVLPALGKSIQLGSLSFIFAMVFGIFMGVISAARRNQIADHLSMSVALMGICVPNFVVGPLLVLLFGLTLGWLPVAGWPEAWPPTIGELRSMILPAITLGLVHVAYISRLARAGMLDVLTKDFIRTARAKGVEERHVFMRHAFKNGITPVLSYSGPMAAAILTGSVVVEQIFTIPGLGRHFVQSAFNRDYALCTGAILVYSVLVILFNLVVDLGYAFLDPRVRPN